MEALRAGADILLVGETEPELVAPVVDLIVAAVEDGTVPRDEFDESTRRILRAKQRFCLLRDGARPDAQERATLAERVATEADAALSTAHAVQAAVLVEDDGGVLPLTGRVLYAGPGTVIIADPGSTWSNVLDSTLGEALAEGGADVTSLTWLIPLTPEAELPRVLNAAAEADVLVLATLQGWFSADQMQLVEWLVDAVDIPVVHVSLGVPFDHAQTRGRVAAGLALMNPRGNSLRAAAAILLGEEEAGGVLSWDLAAVPWEEPYPEADRCAEQGLDCSGLGTCVDHYTVFGCVCAHGSAAIGDGLDCQ